MGNVALGVTSTGAGGAVDVSSVSSSVITTRYKHGLCAGDAVQFSGDDDDLRKTNLGPGAQAKSTDTALDAATAGSVAIALSTAGDYAKFFAGMVVRITSNARPNGELADVTASSSGSVTVTRRSATGANGAVAHSGTKKIQVYTVPALYVIASGLTDDSFKVSTSVGGSAAALRDDDGMDVIVTPTDTVRSTSTKLAADMTSNGTTLTVADASVLPAAPFVAIIDGPKTWDPDEQEERVLVTAKSGNDLTVVRGYEGTRATAHTDDDSRNVYARSLAPSAMAMAGLDAIEARIRAACNKDTDDSIAGLRSANTLLRFTASGTTVTTVDSGGSATAHGMVQGDRFVIVARSGTAGQGENVRLGHTYYVRSAPTSSTLTFCAERLHSSGDPYHAFAVETAAVDVGTAITGTGSYAFLRRLTSGGGTTRLLLSAGNVPLGLYPRLWGWGSNVGMLRERVITAVLHLRAVVDRGAQSLIHHTTMCNAWDDDDIKHTAQSLTFKETTGGTFSLVVSAESSPVTLATSAAADNIIDTATAHGLRENDVVVFPSLTGGSGLARFRSYYVIADSLGTTTFKVSLKRGGTEVDFTTNVTAGTVKRIAVETSAITYAAKAPPERSLTTGCISDILAALRAIPGLTDERVTSRAAGELTLVLATCDKDDDIVDTVDDHGLVAGDRVSFTFLKNDGGAGIDKGKDYFVISSGLGARTFKFSATRGGSAVNFTTNIVAGSKISTPRHPRVLITFAGSRRGLVDVLDGDLRGDDERADLGDPEFLLIPSQSSQVTERWARQGAQIALVSPARVLFRMNFEFEKRYFAWTAYPKNGGTTGQQHAYDAWGDTQGIAAWRAQWQAMATALVTTGGASNARIVLCPADGSPRSAWGGAYVVGAVDLTGWDYYVKKPWNEPASTGTVNGEKRKGTNQRLADNVAALRSGSTSSLSVIVCEFGFGAGRKPQKGRKSRRANLDIEGAFDYLPEVGAGDPDEIPGPEATGSPAHRTALFTRWMQRLYSNHDAVKGALYWDMALGDGTDWFLTASPSLISAFATEICKAKTRTLVS